MMDRIASAAAAEGLAVAGAFHPGEGDGTDAGTLVLLGPDGPAMWDRFTAAPEFADGAPDPLDRWSRRVISALAAALGAAARFPFGGPPHEPFLRWAMRGEGARPSPVGMLVSPRRGLWMSYRGALAFAERLPLDPTPPADPCAGCAAPCLGACPVGAMGRGPYDVAACAAHVASPEGSACREGGCLVRHACPAGSGAELMPQQCGFHMEAFLRERLPLDRR